MAAANGTYKSLKYGEDISIEDYSTLPDSSVHAMLQRGLAHYFGNEVSTHVSALAKKREDDGHGFNDAERAAAKHDFTQQAWKALCEGTVGANIRGPRGTAIETDMRRLAESEVRAILKAHRLSFPTGDKEVTFPDGQGGTVGMTAKVLVDRRLASHGDRLRKKAVAEAADRDRIAAASKSEGSSASGMEAMGL